MHELSTRYEDFAIVVRSEFRPEGCRVRLVFPAGSETGVLAFDTRAGGSGSNQGDERERHS